MPQGMATAQYATETLSKFSCALADNCACVYCTTGGWVRICGAIRGGRQSI